MFTDKGPLMAVLIEKIVERWNKPNGYRQVLNVSLPLVASMGSITLMQFTDRIFLANYSVDAIAAALPAGIASFTAIAFFMGVANYTNAFVAQYTGAQALNRVGAAVWQGIYFSLLSGVLLASFYFVSDMLFELIGHSPRIRALEATYFNILTPDKGTPLYDRMLEENRITNIDDLGRWPGDRCFIKPQNYSPQSLEDNVRALHNSFYSYPSMLARLPMPVTISNIASWVINFSQHDVMRGDLKENFDSY